MGPTSILCVVSASLALAGAAGATPGRSDGASSATPVDRSASAKSGNVGDSSVLFARARRHYEFGMKAMKVGNFARARKQFDQAVAHLPAYPEAHLGLGHVAMSERRFDDALREYTLARDGYETWEQAVADVYVEHFRDSREEIQILRENLNSLRGVYGSQIPATTAQTMILDIEGRIRRLESQADPTPAERPTAPPETHFYIGNALWRLDRPNDALREWQICAEGNPRFPLVHNNLAVAYWHRGEMAQARASLQRAEQLGLAVPADFRNDLGRSGPRGPGSNP